MRRGAVQVSGQLVLGDVEFVAIMPQPMSTPTALGMTAFFVG